MERKFRNPHPFGGRKSRKEAGEEENEILFWLVDHRLGLGLNVFKVDPVPSQLLTDFGEFKTPSGKKTSPNSSFFLFFPFFLDPSGLFGEDGFYLLTYNIAQS